MESTLDRTGSGARQQHATGASIAARSLALAIAIAGVCAHFYGLEAVPRGFYVDEASIAYNAHTIATTGRDEHGVAWPLYFEAFGEYKNPLYIYFVALLYKVIGYSEAITRGASALCWFFGSWFLYGLGRRLFRGERARLYLLLCLGFTPWLFSLSRISFELIALYPVLALHLLAVHLAYEDCTPRWAAVAGAAIGSSLYAYSTFRLLAPAHTLLVFACYPQRRFWTRHLALAGAASLAALPLLGFAFAGGLAKLSLRFDSISYLHDADLSSMDKLWRFCANYTGYFGLKFLALSGDPNLRHHTGSYGELLMPCAVMLLWGVAIAFRSGAYRRPFVRLLFGGILLAPVAAALTRDPHHSLRAFSLAIGAILVSTLGVQQLEDSPKHRRWASAFVLFTAMSAASYLYNYFHAYPAISALALRNYGFKQAFDQARRLAHGKVIVSEASGADYIEMLFYGSLLPPTSTPAKMGRFRDLEPGDVYVFPVSSNETPRYQAGLPIGTLYAVRRFGD